MKEKDDIVCLERNSGGVKLKKSGLLKVRLGLDDAACFQLKRQDARDLMRGLQRFLKEQPITREAKSKQ